MLDIGNIAAEVRSNLPQRYDPLLVTFHIGSTERNGFVAIGDDEGTELCLQLDTGCIYAVDPAHVYLTRFVNSGIQQLAQSLHAHTNYANRVTQSHREDFQLAIVDKFHTQLTEIDPKAVSDPENWWSVIVEQARNGLL